MKEIYHFSDYNEFLEELNSYKGDHYKIIRSGDIVVVTFKQNDEFVACLQFIKQ